MGAVVAPQEVYESVGRDASDATNFVAAPEVIYDPVAAEELLWRQRVSAFRVPSGRASRRVVGGPPSVCVCGVGRLGGCRGT